MQNIRPWLWFDTQAEEAARFYVSIFPNSKIVSVSYYGEAGPRPAGLAMVVTFELDGVSFMALNGGGESSFTPAFYVDCQTQAEVDHLWDRLGEGGSHGQCGWLQDRYGVSWNVVPSALGDLMSQGDEAQSQRVMAAMLGMSKLDIATLQRAYAGG